jgi:TIGR03009 family protein
MNLRLAATMAACAGLVLCLGTTLHAQIDPQGQVPQGPLPQQVPQPGAAGSQQSGPQQYAPSRPPAPPFVLTPQEQADLDVALAAWEKQSGQMKTFKCNFVHWIYDRTFAPPGNPGGPRSISTGELNYAAPDKGSFEEIEVTTWQFNPTSRQLEQVKLEHGEHWACDGKSIFKVEHQKREVHETKLPPAMQGQAITEGPLPFAFGAQAAKLKARYFIRISTPADATGEIWLDIRPKLQTDVVNFIGVEVILHTPDMLPKAIKIQRTQNDSDVYKFEKRGFEIPNIFATDMFHPKPFGYKLIVENPPGQAGPPGPGNNPLPGGNSQASRPNSPNGPGEHH